MRKLRLGYVELGMAGRMLLEGTFRRRLNHQLALAAFAQELEAAAAPEECWRAACRASRAFGFTEAEMRLNGDRFWEANGEANGHGSWRVEIPLASEGWLRLTRCIEAAGAPTVLAPFAELKAPPLADNVSRLARPAPCYRL